MALHSTMIPRLFLRPTISTHVVRVACDAASGSARPPHPIPQHLSQTRGLSFSPRRNVGFLGLLAALFESPQAPELTVSEPTAPEPAGDPKPTAFGLGTPALAAQDSRRRSPTITTLSPERLTAADVIHLPRDAHTFTVSFKPLLELSSNVSAGRPTIPSSIFSSPRWTTPPVFVPRPSSIASTAPPPRVPHEVTLRAASGAGDLEGVQFPAGLGCLYYHTPPAPCTPLAGALRLRALPSLGGDPKTWTDESVRGAFARGRDFCVLPGIPWHVPVLALTGGGSSGAGYDAVRAMLLRERLVAPGVMRDAEREGRRWGFKRHGSRVVHGFGQPFVVDLSTKALRFYFVGRRRVYTHVFRDLCSWNMRGTNEAYQPFTGRGKRQWSLWLANVKTVFRWMRVLFENDSMGIPGKMAPRKS